MEPNQNSLSDLRQRLQISQHQLGAQIGASQSAVLKIERSTDPQVSTIRRYVNGLAALASETVHRLRLTVQIDDETVEIATPEKTEPVLPDTKSQTDWRLRAWDDAALEHRWHTEGVIAISQDEVGDMTDWPGDDQLRKNLERSFKNRDDERSKQAYGTFVRYWRYFCLDMSVGDLVAVPLVGRRVGIAEITGNYNYQASENDPRMRHQRSVKWLTQIDRSELPEPLRKVVNAPGTICRIQHGDLSTVGL